MNMRVNHVRYKVRDNIMYTSRMRRKHSNMITSINERFYLFPFLVLLSNVTFKSLIITYILYICRDNIYIANTIVWRCVHIAHLMSSLQLYCLSYKRYWLKVNNRNWMNFFVTLTVHTDFSFKDKTILQINEQDRCWLIPKNKTKISL